MCTSPINNNCSRSVLEHQYRAQVSVSVHRLILDVILVSKDTSLQDITSETLFANSFKHISSSHLQYDCMLWKGHRDYKHMDCWDTFYSQIYARISSTCCVLWFRSALNSDNCFSDLDDNDPRKVEHKCLYSLITSSYKVVDLANNVNWAAFVVGAQVTFELLLQLTHSWYQGFLTSCMRADLTQDLLSLCVDVHERTTKFYFLPLLGI